MLSILPDQTAKNLTDSHHPTFSHAVLTLPVVCQLAEAWRLYFMPGHEAEAIALFELAAESWHADHDELEEPRWH